jgi:hypothetical protein
MQQGATRTDELMKWRRGAYALPQNVSRETFREQTGAIQQRA